MKKKSNSPIGLTTFTVTYKIIIIIIYVTGTVAVDAPSSATLLPANSRRLLEFRSVRLVNNYFYNIPVGILLKHS